MKNKKFNLSRYSDLFPLIGLIVLILLFSLTSGSRFLSSFNLSNIINQASIILVTGVGVSFIISHGNLDLSCGGSMAMCGVLTYLLCEKIGFAFMIPACLLIGLLIGTVTGSLHVFGRIPSFLAGFAMLSLGRGISTISVSHKMRVPQMYKGLNNLPLYLIVIVLTAVIAHFVMEYTRIGKFNKLIGINPNTTKLSGINVSRYKLYAFMINGLTIGIATFLTFIRAGSFTNTTGNGIETNTLIAVVIGGMPLAGGSKSRISASVLGALLFTVLNNGLTIWGVDANLINVIKGIVFLAIVIMTVDRKSRTISA